MSNELEKSHSCQSLANVAYSTFRDRRDLKGDADDSLKILNRDERPQNGPDTDCLSFASLN